MQRTVFPLILFIITACSASAQPAVEGIESCLAGRWEWVRDVSDFRGPPSASGSYGPLNCKCEKHLIFKDGIVYQYRNDSLVSTSTYGLRELHFMHDPVKVVFESKSLNGYIEITGDEMRIGWFGSCATTQHYKRKTG